MFFFASGQGKPWQGCSEVYVGRSNFGQFFRWKIGERNKLIKLSFRFWPKTWVNSTTSLHQKVCSQTGVMFWKSFPQNSFLWRSPSWGRNPVLLKRSFSAPAVVGRTDLEITTQWSTKTGQVISNISIHTDDPYPHICRLKVFRKTHMIKESLRHAYHVSLPCRIGCFGTLGACRVLKSGGPFFVFYMFHGIWVQNNVEPLNCTNFNHLYPTDVSHFVGPKHQLKLESASVPWVLLLCLSGRHRRRGQLIPKMSMITTSQDRRHFGGALFH